MHNTGAVSLRLLGTLLEKNKCNKLTFIIILLTIITRVQ